MANASQLPTAEVDFVIHSDEAGTSPSHSRDQTFSSPPAPPLSTALSPETQDYAFSSNIYDDYAASRSTSAHEDEYATEEDDLNNGLAPIVAHSTRSSISSFPGSILPDARQQRLSTPSKSPSIRANPDVLHHGRSGSLSYKIRSPASRLRESDRNIPIEREHASAFRNPSSVRAMQMRDEEPFDSDPETTPHHRRSGSRTSNFSHRSVNASPTKRSSRSMHSTSHKVPSPSKLKKEFPLVLLHCSLLPPTLALKAHIIDETLMEEVLPAEYWRRWKILQDKVGEDKEVRTRGVLIPHPRDDYDVLEERLLESLELERPRLRKGHFMAGLADADSGVGTESERDTENESDVDGQSVDVGLKPPNCPDCGKRLPREIEADRKWEVKVYAANGLMRAGAWAAAWSEMEKVDVEVSVWMPESVRRDIDARLRELGVFDNEGIQQELEESFVETAEQQRQREIYGRSSHGQETAGGMADEDSHKNLHEDVHLNQGLHPTQTQPEPDLTTLAVRYIRGAMQDRRNIFMALLSTIVLFLALSKPPAASGLVAHHDQPLASTKQESPVTMTSVSILTSTEVVTATVVTTATSSIPYKVTRSMSIPIASSAEEPCHTTSGKSRELVEPTKLSADDTASSTSTNTGPSEEATPEAEEDEPTMLEQVAQMVAEDDVIPE